MKNNKSKIDCLTYIKSLVDDSIGLTSKWEQNQVKWSKMRYRIKKTKTFPFPGCSNIRMPTIETKLRKVKAGLVNIIFGIRPVVQVIPTPSSNWSSAIKVEKFLDHLIMDVMKIKPKSIVAIDQSIEKGFFLIKPYWKVETINRVERLDIKELSMGEAIWLFDADRSEDEVKQAIITKYDVDMHDMLRSDNMKELDRVTKAILEGEDNIEVTFQDMICNYPDISLCEPERIYVPTDAGYHPDSCSWIIHEFMMDIEMVKNNVKYKNWDAEEITKIEYKEKNTKYTEWKDKNIDVEKDFREGISQLDKNGKVRIWEFYGYYDINNDGEEELSVITIAPDFNRIIRKVGLPFFSGKKPFVKLFYELTDDRWFSHRGIPEMIEDIVKEIDIQHNQKIDQQSLRNAPMYVHRAGQINKNTIQFVFGQSIPVQGMTPLNDVIAPLNNNNPNVEFSYEREQMMLESKIEELIGQVDYTLQSMINKRQPRTLGEVNLQSQNMQQVFGLDADLCRMSFEELFNWIWELWCQYGDEEYEFMYFGKEGFEKIKLTKEEIQKKYKITVRGNDQNTNPQVRFQKAQAIMMGLNNPPALQSGVITPINIYNSFKRFYQELDIPNWEELVSQPQQPQPQTPDVKMGMQDLTDAEQAQILAKYGIQPDAKGRALRSQAIIQDKQREDKSKSVEDITKVFKTIGEMDAQEESTEEEPKQ